jgi:pimeloyl-ACP methyl ester carboxylesterase
MGWMGSDTLSSKPKARRLRGGRGGPGRRRNAATAQVAALAAGVEVCQAGGVSFSAEVARIEVAGAHWVTVGDERLEVAWVGAGPGPVLVFLHEGLGCAALWKELPAQLCARLGCRAVVYSRAGYGGSSPVPPRGRPVTYLRREGELGLPALLDRLGVAQAVLVGHSDGASIALCYAMTEAAPDRLRGVVALAPHTFVEALTLRSIEQAREAYLTGELRRRLQRYHGDNVDGAFWGWNGMWLDPAFAAWSVVEELPRVTVPLLAIQGRDDEYGTLRQLEVLQERCAGPVAPLVLDHCGHSPQRDQAQATTEAIAEFVAAL